MVGLADDLKVRFKNLVNERTGPYFKDYALKDLEGAVSQRMKSRRLESPLSYYNVLVMSEEKEGEFRELLNILTVNHTYFFRNEPQFKVLQEKILPKIIARKLKSCGSGIMNRDWIHDPRSTIHETRPSLRIWSAGCSTGEEPYTIAIVLCETIPNIENWDVRILATDASESALKKARRGEYSENAIKRIPPDYLDKYFESTKSSGRTTLHDKVRKMVKFAFFNLMDEDYPIGFDIIFCRNVTIYFEMETTVKVANRLSSSLLDDGYLFIGYAETLQYLSDKFRMRIDGEAIYYRKAEAVAARPYAARPKEEAPDLDKILDELSRKQAIAELEAELAKPKSLKDIKEILAEAIKLIHLKEYKKALRLIAEANKLDGKAFDPYYMAAEILMNQGRFDDARNKLNDALKISPLFAPAHYLLGCIYIEEGVPEKAKDSNEDKAKEAIREYRNTITATDGQEARDKARKESPDLMILDLMLPKMDGYRV